MFQQILIYWAIAQVLGLVGLPLGRLLFGALPDRGYAFSKPLGLLLTAYLAWLLAMLGLAPFGAPLLILGAVAVAALGMAAHPEGRPAALWAWLRERWRAVLWYELVFTIALIYLAVQRSYSWGFVGPNPWGTERPMDFAFFNAIQESASFPPHDPWMSGFSINYYYFGYLLMAGVAILSGLAPGVTYNLSLAVTFALTAQAIVGLVAALVGLTRGRIGRGGACAAGLAAIMILFGGNQGGALQILSGTEKILALDGSDMASAVANGIGPRATLTLSRLYRGEIFGTDGTTTITPIDTVKDFNWWWPSRALWDRPPSEEWQSYAITEFPFFSFWLGDMHPHVMALPFGLLALALALQTVVRTDLPAYGRGRAGWAELVGGGVILGALYAINSWDFPTFLLLFLGALLLRYAREGRLHAEQLPWRRYLTQAAPVVIAAFALYLPFYLTFKSLVGGKAPLVDLPLLSILSKTISLVGWPKTPLQTFFIIFGLFLLPALAWAMPLAIARHRWSIDLGVLLGALACGLLVGFPLLALAPLAFLLGRAALDLTHEGRHAPAFALMAFAVVCAISLGTEIIFLRDVFDNRMNTIFKFYYQIWMILGVLAGFAVWALIWEERRKTKDELARTMDDGRWTIDSDAEGPGIAEPQNHGTAKPRTENPGPIITDEQGPAAIDTTDHQPPATSRQPATAGEPPSTVHRPSSQIYQLPTLYRIVSLALFAVLLIGALVYPYLTLSKLYSEGTEAGLNGKSPRENTPDGEAAVGWLRANVPGDSVILEAVAQEPIFSYDTGGQGFAGVSSATGLATVMGWTGHQQQWRGGDPTTLEQILPRRQDVETIYTTTNVDEARALLDKYRVRYVYIGSTERSIYPQEGLAKFDQIGSPVFQQGDVTIYRVGG